MKRVVLMTAAMAAIGVAMADFVPTREIGWYQTSIPSYVAGTDLTNQTETAGDWSLSAGFADQSIVEVVTTNGVSSIELEAAPGQNISFAASAAAPAGADGSVVTTKLTFTPWSYGMLTDPGQVQGAFTMREKTADGVLEFVGYTATGWVAMEPLDGVLLPADGLVATLKMQMDYSSSPAKVCYSLSTDDGATWLTMADTNGNAWVTSATTKTAPGQNGETVEYSGVGTIHTLGQIGYDSTRAIAVCGSDDVPHYYSTNELLLAKAQMDADPTAFLYCMQDLSIALNPGDTLTINMAHVVPGSYNVAVNVPAGCTYTTTLDQNTGLTTFTVIRLLQGSGTEQDPFLISDVTTLKAFRDGVNAGVFGQSGEYFLQTANIDMQGEGGWIGPGTYYVNGAIFSGVYDGGNCEVSNLSISNDTDNIDYVGFFGAASNATIKNLKLVNVSNNADSLSVCGVIGMAYGTTVIENVTVSGRIEGAYNTAGFCCYVGNNVSFISCTNHAAVFNRHCKTGGFVPYNGSGGTYLFRNCLNDGEITGLHEGSNNALASAGGFWGWLNSGNPTVTFEDCVNAGNVTIIHTDTVNKGSGCRAGGFIACDQAAGSAVSFTRCVNTGTITASNMVDTAAACAGGLMGSASSTITLTDCTSTGSLSAVTTVENGQTRQASFVASVAADKVTASGTNTALADEKPISAGPCDGLNFATVSGGIATFCATPSTSGSYKVMLANSENISFGAAAADTLALDMSLAAYSGTVTSLLDGYTATAGEPVADVTTWTLSANYPTYLADADSTVKAAYTAWATANGADTASQYENAFLLDVSPRVEIPNAALAITEITKAVQGWDIVVECTVENADLSGTPNTARVGNGYLAVWYKDTLGGEWTKENIVITDSTNGKVTVNVNRASAKFMKVSLKSTAEPAAE